VLAFLGERADRNDAYIAHAASTLGQVETFMARTDEVLARLDNFALHSDIASGRRETMLQRATTTLEQLEASLTRSEANTSARIAHVGDRIAQLESNISDRIAQSASNISDRIAQSESGISDRIAQSESGISDRIAYVAHEQDRHLAAAFATENALRAIPAMFGPRFDEIEVKLRPLIPFDETSWAVRFRDGYVMVPSDKPLFLTMLADATSAGLEPGTRRVLQALAPVGGAAADVGANIGLLTIALARAVGPSGRVYSFEPELAARNQLLKTLHLHGMVWVHVSDAAVGAQTEERTFHTSTVPGHSSLYELPDAEEAVQSKVNVVRLDDAVPIGSVLDVVKIDVEGAELDVLEGMERVLLDNPDLAIVAEYGPSHLARVGIAPKAWLSAFTNRGFAIYEIEEPTGAVRRISLRGLSGVVSVNLAFVKPRGAAEKRLRAL
jgi:FkbM family methyltransferase